MIEARDKYIYGSAAEKLQDSAVQKPEYNVYEENKVLKAKKQQKQNNRAKLGIVFNLLLIFLFGFIIIYRYALITELNYSIDKLNGQYNDIRNENSRLKFAIEETMNLANIEEIAEDKLGMQKPDKSQLVYVSVPKSDYSIASATYEKTPENNGVFAAFFNKIGGLANLLY